LKDVCVEEEKKDDNDSKEDADILNSENMKSIITMKFVDSIVITYTNRTSSTTSWKFSSGEKAFRNKSTNNKKY
jgi:hypothetical protein